MYQELVETWRKENESSELEKLPADFFVRVADYLKHLREEGRMLDRRTLKARLLRTELKNVKRIIWETTQMRFRKVVSKAVKGESAPSDVLAPEEELICGSFASFAEAYQSFVKELLRGRISKVVVHQEHKMTVVRFVKDLPAVIGLDMKPYGPFKTEDVATLPLENTFAMIKRGFAERIEISYVGH